MITKTPQHIQENLGDKLILTFCNVCGKVCYASVSKLPWNLEYPNKDIELYATCLSCGHKDRDNNKWMSL